MRRSKCGCKCSHCISMGNVPKGSNETTVARNNQGRKDRRDLEPSGTMDRGALVAVQSAAVRQLRPLPNVLDFTQGRCSSVDG